MEHLEEWEFEQSKSIKERLGKVIVVGVIGLIATSLAEKFYDNAADKRRAVPESTNELRNSNAHKRSQVQ